MRPLWWFSLLAAGVATGKVLIYDTYYQRFGAEGTGPFSLQLHPFINPVLASAILAALVAVVALVAGRRNEWLTSLERTLVEIVVPVVGAYVLIHILSFELDRWFRSSGMTRFTDPLHAERVGLSVLWALMALLYVVTGLIFHVRSIRLFGLVVFAVTAGKVLLRDMAHAAVVYRMLSALGLGVLSLLGSYAYQRVRRTAGQELQTSECQTSDQAG